LKKKWSVSNFQWFGFFSESPDLDAEERLVCACVGVAEVVHVAGADERHVGLLGECDQLRIQSLLDLHVRVLQLDVDVVATEDGAEAVELCVRVGRAVLFERLVDAA